MTLKATFEQSEMAACNIIRFLIIKIFQVFFYNVTLNVNLKFLKIAMLKPILFAE